MRKKEGQKGGQYGYRMLHSQKLKQIDRTVTPKYISSETSYSVSL